jgi:hypothetical protein
VLQAAVLLVALDRVKSASKDTSPASAKRADVLIVKECQDAPPFVELAEARLKE